LFRTLKKEGIIAFWKLLNGNFILSLLLGILVSYLTFMRIAKYLIEHHPILIWSFFFGLIVASIFFVGKQIKAWNVPTIIGLVLGALAAYYITSLPSMASSEQPLFLFFAGALAICAMILPGISGSFILVILGAYKTLSDALHDFDLKKVGLFTLGAFIGLLSFSHVLKWLFKHYHNITLAILTGFIFGSLNKIWPWKVVLTWREISNGKLVPVLEKSISPSTYNGDPQLVFAISLMVIGFLTIFILEKLGSKKV
jgi:putative membrane protein